MSKFTTRSLDAEIATDAELSQEISDRIAADTNLQSQIDALSSAGDPLIIQQIQNDLDVVEASLAQEIIDRQTQDQNLQTQVDTLNSELDQEILSRSNADDTLQSNINAEETARISADLVLQSNIDIETAARISSDNQLQASINSVNSALSQEISDRIADVNSEESRALAVESLLQSNIDVEEAARIAEDLTFLKLDGSRSMTGTLNLDHNNILNINKSQKKILITTPTFTTATTNGTLNLADSSSSVHFITGTASNFSIVFPNATTLDLGVNYEIYNRSSSPVMLKYFDGSMIGVLSPESVSSLILQDNSTSVGIYSPFQVEVNQASGVANYNVNSNTPFATSSSVYVPITDFVVTPAHGKYAVWFNCSASSTNNNSQNTVAIYKNGVIVQDSERNQQAVSSNFNFQLNTLAIIDFNGTEQLQVFIKVSTGTLTIGARTGVALRLGPVG